MLEWADKNKYNSFNSEFKSLTFYEQYRIINEWRLNKRKTPLAPIEISLDPIATCQLYCTHCNFSKYFQSKIDRLTDEHYLNLIQFFADWGVKAICFTGDTKVKLVNGTHKTFKELEKEWNQKKEPFEVYSRDKKGNIVPGIATNPRKTQEVKELIEITLDNNKIIKCTPNHKFMLRDGSYKEAKDLTKNDSLMPLYTKLTGNYEFIKDVTYQGSTHKLFSIYWNGNRNKVLKNKLVIHHKNYNKLDNTKKNLQQVTPKEHGIIHIPKGEHKKKLEKARDKWNSSREGIFCHKKQMKKAQKKSLKYWRSKEGKKQNALKLIKYNKSERGRKKSGEIFSRFNNSKKGKQNSLYQLSKINSNRELVLQNNQNPRNIAMRRLGQATKILQILKKSNLEINEQNYNKYWNNGLPKWDKAKEILGFNHKIISKKIIKLKTPISVYCLTVEKYHNFALSAGIFVKNCHGGGGEPTLHTKLWDALLFAKKLNIENSIATNGINFNDETIDIALETCRWIGISIDAATSKTYKVNRKGDYFDKVIENLKKFNKRVKELNTNCDISFKFLIFDYNQYEIYEACKLAKSLGVKDYHVRPADWKHQGRKIYEEKQKFYDIESILKQFEQCHKLENKNFRVFTICHKFNIEDFIPKRDFNQCYASPICLQINPDNCVYLCPDTRKLEFYKLGEHYPDPKNILNFWGSQKHYDLVFKEGCKNCKWRCTFSPYNKMFQDLFIDSKDSLCRNFV